MHFARNAQSICGISVTKQQVLHTHADTHSSGWDRAKRSEVLVE